jgi:hypothetical protein
MELFRLVQMEPVPVPIPKRLPRVTDLFILDVYFVHWLRCQQAFRNRRV